jgi:serine/threonine protein kinase
VDVGGRSSGPARDVPSPSAALSLANGAVAQQIVVMADHLTPLIAALADRFRLERELGAAGIATVYLARDLKHDRDVAIKVHRVVR